MTGASSIAPTPTSAAPSAPASAPASGSASGSASGKLTGVPSACPSPDEVSAALHISAPTVRPSAGLGALNCLYLLTVSGTTSQVTVSFTPMRPGETPADYQALLSGLNSNVQPVPGVGDAAFSFTATGNTGLGFISAGTICLIESMVPVQPADMISLAQKILNG